MVAFATKPRPRPKYHVVIPTETEGEARTAAQIAVFTGMVRPGDVQIVSLEEEEKEKAAPVPQGRPLSIVTEVVMWCVAIAVLLWTMWRAGQ